MKRQELQVRRGRDEGPLLDFLANRLNLSRKRAKGLLDQRAVFVNGHPVWMARHPLQEGDKVGIRAGALSGSSVGKESILWEDAHLLAVNKPAGLLANGPNSLESAVRALTKEPGTQALHRLDRDTSGCILFARSPRAQKAMIRLFRDKEISKIYHALVWGRMAMDTTTIRKSIAGQSAVTHLTVLHVARTASHVKLSLETGRTHQARKHLASIRHPVLGDTTHGLGRSVSAIETPIPRQMLHARRIAFRHPITLEKVQIEAPLPGDFRQCMKDLGLK